MLNSRESLRSVGMLGASSMRFRTTSFWMAPILAFYGIIGCTSTATTGGSSDASNGDDACGDIVGTPGGPAARECVHEVPNGATVGFDDAGGSIIMLGDEVIATYPPCPCHASGGLGLGSTDGSPDGGGCRVVLASDYDQACTHDTDCVAVGEVPSCPAAACDGCPAYTVSTEALAQYTATFRAAAAAIAGADCGCPALNPYCLWIGAGVGVHLGQAAGSVVPGWAEVVDRLEREAGLSPPRGIPYTDRIERCLRALGRVNFQRHLRAAVFRPLAEATIKLAEAYTTRVPSLPTAVRQLAHLGALANPVVNFNVETTTSRLTVDPSGRSNIRCFGPSVPGATTLLRAKDPHAVVFRRSVYHPHGAIDESGICVMAASEYESMRGTLGLQLAVHNAFENKLMIVGMSLEDRYLREQLKSFRSQIGAIYWFVDSVQPDDEAWAWSNNVILVQQPWPTFWARVQAILPGPLEEAQLYQTWRIVMTEAYNECFGRPLTCRYIAVQLQTQEDQGKVVAADSFEELRWLARIRGEEGGHEMSREDSIGLPPKEAIEAVHAVDRGTFRLCLGPMSPSRLESVFTETTTSLRTAAGAVSFSTEMTAPLRKPIGSKTHSRATTADAAPRAPRQPRVRRRLAALTTRIRIPSACPPRCRSGRTDPRTAPTGTPSRATTIGS